MVNQVFQKLLGQNKEAYIDNMLMKSQHAKEHITDSEERMITLKQHYVRLNPSKCQFRMTTCKFLGYLTHEWRSDPNLDKVQYILNIFSSTLTKEVQRLIG